MCLDERIIVSTEWIPATRDSRGAFSKQYKLLTLLACMRSQNESTPPAMSPAPRGARCCPTKFKAEKGRLSLAHVRKQQDKHC